MINILYIFYEKLNIFFHKGELQSLHQIQLRNCAKMPHVLESRLPSDLIPVLKLFTGELRERNGKYMRQIPKQDIRYKVLRKLPRVLLLDYHNHFAGEKKSCGFTWFKTIDRTKHITISIYYNPWLQTPGLVREFKILGKESILTYV